MLKYIAGIFLAVASFVASAAVVDVSQYVRNDGYGIASWASLAKNDSGSAAVTGPWRGMKTVQITVTAAGEQSIGIQGSMDNVTWFTLHSLEIDTGELVPLSGITTSTLASIVEEPLYIRPLVTNEAGATTVNISVVLGAATRN